MIADILKIFVLAATAFFIGIALNPLLARVLCRYKCWRKNARERSPDGTATPIFNKLHAEREIRVPRMGGMLVWIIPLAMSFLFLLLGRTLPGAFFQKLHFLSRSQTWLPLFTLVAASVVGAADDLIQIFSKGKYVAGGMRFSRRLVFITLIALIGAYWFFFKLEADAVFVPFYGEVFLGWLFVPFFVLVLLATFSGSVIDGLDGLAGGTLASAFAAYAGIAWAQGQVDLAAFAAIIVGALLAFLWFNIPPARFYMGETGMFGLTSTLAVVAFLTGQVAVLPIIAFPLVITSLSVILQFASKRFRGRKLFRVAPLHHHFEVVGWPAHTVVMRYWVVSVIFALLGMVAALAGRV